MSLFVFRRFAIALVLVATGARGAEIPAAERRSDTAAMTPALQAMQADDAANPGMLSVLDGEALWSAAPPNGRPSCAGCHGEASSSMKGVAARYPAWNQALNRPVDLAGRIDLCRATHQSLPPLRRESPEQLALAAYLAFQSRGVAIAPDPDARMAEARNRGRTLFTTRMGQLNLSCAQCHDERWGGLLAGSPIPQAHPVGYPIYRLEWQSTGSLQRRFRNCMTGVRAEPFPAGAPEYVDLEAYLMERAAGLAIETPAIRP